jgi:hypothetical protein
MAYYSTNTGICKEYFAVTAAKSAAYNKNASSTHTGHSNIAGIYLMCCDKHLGCAICGTQAQCGIGDTVQAGEHGVHRVVVERDTCTGDGLRECSCFAWKVAPCDFVVLLKGQNGVGELTEAEAGGELDAEVLASGILGDVVHIQHKGPF